MLLLFPPKFRLATILLVINSVFTIACLVVAKDWKGGFIELSLLQIPVFLLWVGYPMFALEKLRTLFWK